MMKTVRVLIRFAFMLTMSSIAVMAQSVQTDFDRSYDLSKLKSYAFHQQVRRPGDPLAASPLNDRRIHNAIDAELKANGFAEMQSGRPDFWVTYYVTTRQGLDIQDNRWGIRQRMGSVEVNQVTEGTIVVVFVDSVTGLEVWRGIVSDTISSKDFEKDINKGVAKLVQKFLKDQAGKK